MLLRARFSVCVVDSSEVHVEKELSSFTLDREPGEPLLDFIDRIDVEEDRIRTMLENMEASYGQPVREDS
jgi:hypothetical protein